MTSNPNVRHRSRRVPIPGTAAPQEPAPKKAARDRAAPDYKVGYGKPPKGGQFKPGKSGNSKGRPKGARNLQTLIDAELNKIVVIHENGKRRKVTNRVVVAKRVVHKAVEGQDRAIKTILDVDQDLAAAIEAESVAAAGTNGGEPMNETRRAILTDYTDHLKKTLKSSADAGDGPAKPLDEELEE